MRFKIFYFIVIFISIPLAVFGLLGPGGGFLQPGIWYLDNTTIKTSDSTWNLDVSSITTDSLSDGYTTLTGGDIMMQDDKYIYFDTAKSVGVRYDSAQGYLTLPADITWGSDEYINIGDIGGSGGYIYVDAGQVGIFMGSDYNLLVDDVNGFNFTAVNEQFGFNSYGRAGAILDTSLIATSNKTFQFPNISGTLVTTNGALSDIDIGAYILTADTFSGALTGNASTATALASNGANCNAGEYALGVDASGAVENCTDATTEINSVVNGLGGTNLTCASQTCNVDDVFMLNNGDTITGDYDITGILEADTLTDGTLTINSGNLTTTGSGQFDGGVYVGTAPSIYKFHIVGTGSVGLLTGSDASLIRWSVDNSGAGDAELSFLLGLSTKWSMGVDNSDADSFAISPSHLLSTNKALRIDRTTRDVIIYNDLDVVGDLTADTGTFRDGGIFLGDSGYHLNIRVQADQLDADEIIEFNPAGTSPNIISVIGNSTISDWFNQSVKTTASPNFTTLGIGRTPEYYSLEMEGAGTGAWIRRITNNAGTGRAPFFWFWRAQGTTGSPTAVNSSSQLMKLQASGLDVAGSGFGELAAAIEIWVDGTVGAGDVPGKMLFFTSAGGTSYERMAIRSDGDVRIFNNLKVGADADPTVALDVNGEIKVSSHISIASNGEVRFYDNGNYVGFKAPALSADQIWTLPSAGGNDNEIIETDSTGVLSFVRMPKAIYAELSDSTDQEFADPDTPFSIKFDTNDEISGITHSITVDSENIAIITTGVYTMFAQPQVATGAGGAGKFHMWLQKNTGGEFADIANTNIELVLASQEENVIPLATTFLLNAGDVIRLRASVSDVRIKLHAQTPAGEPTIPSIIFTMFMIGGG